MRGLAEWRLSDAEAGRYPSRLQRWTLRRLDDAYKAFFRRLKSGGAAGFPRFRGKGWWRSFGFSEFGGIRFDGKRLRFKGMLGGIRVHLHRPLPKDGEIKSCVFTRDVKGWSVCFQIAVPDVEKRAVSTSVGLDLGLKVFAYQSDGVIIPAPQFARRAEKEMRRRQRALARCKRGSARRWKIKERVTRLHQKIANRRTTWMHQQSARIANSYDLIAAEDLNVAGMMHHPSLARSISDASWSKFLSMVSYKAERAGSHFVLVNPRNTSQACSGCGTLVPKTLAVRTHSCPACGLVIDRDWNAAKNILAAVAGGRIGNVAQWSVRRSGNITGEIQ